MSGKKVPYNPEDTGAQGRVWENGLCIKGGGKTGESSEVEFLRQKVRDLQNSLCIALDHNEEVLAWLCSCAPSWR